MKRLIGSSIALAFLALAAGTSNAAVAYPMSAGNYSLDFADIANWQNNFAGGIGASNWSSVGIVATGTIPDGQRTTVSTFAFATSGTASGVQRGSLSGNPAGTIVLLPTGATDNSTSMALDLNLDFSGRTAGTLSFDWSRVNNSTGDRAITLKVYTSFDSITWTELAGASVSVTNNVAGSGTVAAVALPSSLDGQGNAFIRFYAYNSGPGTTGNRAKVSIDNVAVTSTAGPTVAPTIAVQPQSQSSFPQTTTKFSAVATGSTPLSYQWYKDGTPLVGDAKFVGVSSNALFISALDATNAGNYELVVTNTAGAVTSAPPATLTIINTGTLVRWDFNNVGVNTTNISPSAGDLAASTALNGGASGFINPTGSANDSGLPAWGTSTYSVQGTSNKLSGPRFNVSTVGKKNLSVGYDVRSTGTASRHVRLQFTTNGTDWVDAPTSIFTPAGDASLYTTKRTSLVGFPGVDNNANFAFRFVAEWESTATYGATNNNQYAAVSGTYNNTGGTISYDIVTVTAESTDANNAPTITAAANFSILDSDSATNINFTVGDVDTGAAGLVVTATSSNQTAISDSQLVAGGTGASRFITFTPNSGQIGVAPVIVTVTDPSGYEQKTWLYITVLPGNQNPTITQIARTNTLIGTPITIPFTIGDDITAAGSLALSTNSGNQTLVPDANIAIGGSGANRTITLTPASTNEGVAPITITVTDGGGKTATATFALMVRASTNVLFVDKFDYADGSLTTVSAGLYGSHGGTAGQVNVASGQLALTDTESEDVNGPLIGSPHPTNAPYALYSRFVVNMSVLPNDIGNYFAHFKDDTTFNFRDRIYASSFNTNVGGAYRLGTGNTSGTTNSTAQFTQDLVLGSNYVVVTKLNLSNGVSTIWIDPVSEASPSVTDNVVVADPVAITQFAFRQSTSYGTLTIDDLKVATSFNAVMGLSEAPTPVPLTITTAGGQAIVSWTDTTGLFKLATGTNVLQVTNVVSGATSPYTNNITGSETYFRLVYP